MENRINRKYIISCYQILAWFTAWAIFNFVNASGANIYRNAICEYYQVSAAPLLDGVTYGGWIGGVLFLFVPALIRKVGAKNLMVITIILGGIFFTVTPLQGNVIYIAACIMFSGIFAGVYGLMGPMVLVSKWFPKRKGIVMGIVSAGAIGAYVIILPVFNALENTINVKAAMGAVGLFMILFGLINHLLMKENPQDWGIEPDFGEYEINLETDIKADTQAISVGDALKISKLWCMAIGWGLTLLTTIGFSFIGVSYMIEKGLPNSVTITAVAVCGGIQFFMSLISGMIDQKIGPVKTACMFFILQAAGMTIVLFYYGESVAFIVLSYWLICGTFSATNNLSSSQNLSVFRAKHFSTTYNCQCFLNSFLKMLGTYVAARSLNWVGDYSIAYNVFGISLILGIICIIVGGDKPLEIERRQK